MATYFCGLQNKFEVGMSTQVYTPYDHEAYTESPSCAREALESTQNAKVVGA